MSVVTALYLQFSVAEDFYGDPVASPIDKWFRENGMASPTYVDGDLRTPKHPQLAMACGGYNHAELDGLVDLFVNYDWEHPDEAIMVLTHECLGRKVVIPRGNNVVQWI